MAKGEQNKQANESQLLKRALRSYHTVLFNKLY